VIFTGGTSSVTNVDLPEVHMKEACEIDKGHGRLEERIARVFYDVHWLKREKK